MGWIMGLERPLKKHAGGMFLGRGRVPRFPERSPLGLWAGNRHTQKGKPPKGRFLYGVDNEPGKAVKKTWTTDAMYRETPDMIEQRRKEGCITVEMETAAFFAVSKYYDLPLAQLLYAGDDVSGEKWDARNWDKQKNVRSNLIFTAMKLMEEL